MMARSKAPDIQFSQIQTTASEAYKCFSGANLKKMKTLMAEIEDVIIKKDSKRISQLRKTITALKDMLKLSSANNKFKPLNTLISDIEEGLKSRNSRGIDVFGFIKMPDELQVQGQMAPSNREKRETIGAGTDAKESVGIKAELEKLERELQQKHNELIDEELPACTQDEKSTLSIISNIKSLSRSFTDRIEKMGPKAEVAGLKGKMTHETLETILNWLTTLKSGITENVFNEKLYSFRAAQKSPELEKSKDIIIEIVKELNVRRGKSHRNEKEMECVLQQLSELDKEVDAAEYQKKLPSQTTHDELPKRIKEMRLKLNDKWQKLAESKEANEKKINANNALNSQILELWNNLHIEQEKQQKPQKRALPPVPTTVLHELETVLQKQKTIINQSENLQKAINMEIQCLKTDIKKWNSIEMTCSEVMIDKNTSKIVHEIREIRNLLTAEKTKQSSENEKRKAGKEQTSSKMKNLVKSLWNEAFGETHGTNDDKGRDVSQMLNEVTSELKSLHCLQNDVEEEINCLHKEVENWDCSLADYVVTVNKNSPGMLKSLRQIRNKLQQRKNDITEQKQDREKTEKQTQNNIEELWKIVFGETGSAQSQKANSSGRTLLEQMKKKMSKMKDERQDIQIFLDESNEVLMEIQSIVVNEPFLFTDPLGLDREAVVRNTSYEDLCHVKIGIAWIRQCIKENSKSFNERFVKYGLYFSLQENHRILIQTAEKLEAEKIDLSNRLSKVAGAKLTDNNPNIADLSDPNRPTKLAEQYSELYDNQWTDAFDDLNQKEEKDSIAFLLNILMGSYKACTEISTIQQKSLKRLLMFPSENTEDTNREKATEKDAGLTSLQSKTLAELRKQCADLSVGSVRKQIKLEHQDWFKKGALEKYTAKCIDLCWLMQAQSPPVCIDHKLKPGGRVNSNMYKSYTKSGKEVHFLVWPALLLHDGGSVLTKGVAQLK